MKEETPKSPNRIKIVFPAKVRRAEDKLGGNCTTHDKVPPTRFSRKKQ